MSQRGNRLRAFLLQLGRGLRPLISLFCWWWPFGYRKNAIVLLPDSTAIFMVAFGGLSLLPYLSWNFFWLYCLTLLVSPFVFLAALLIQESEVKVVRLFGPMPYWIHKIPAEAKFDLYEAWEDPAPSGVSFGSSAANTLHLGTTASAEPLYRYIGEILEKAGWTKTVLGWQRPS